MELVIHCDGGLGNRLISLVGGLWLADKLGVRYKTHWPANRWFGLALDDCFSESYCRSLNSVRADQLTNIDVAIVSDYGSFDADQVWSVDRFGLLAALQSYREQNQGATVIFSSSIAPSFIGFKDFRNIVSSMHFVSGFYKQAELRRAEFTSRSMFFHIRGHDVRTPLFPVLFFMRCSASLGLKLVVITDDCGVFERVSKSVNCFWLKPDYVLEKFDSSKDFLDLDARERGEFEFNVVRGADSCRSAIVDFLILASSKSVFPNSLSTFLLMALVSSPYYLNARFGYLGLTLVRYKTRLVKWIKQVKQF